MLRHIRRMKEAPTLLFWYKIIGFIVLTKTFSFDEKIKQSIINYWEITLYQKGPILSSIDQFLLKIVSIMSTAYPINKVTNLYIFAFAFPSWWCNNPAFKSLVASVKNLLIFLLTLRKQMTYFTNHKLLLRTVGWTWEIFCWCWREKHNFNFFSDVNA